jgi:hypothetical protein
MWPYGCGYSSNPPPRTVLVVGLDRELPHSISNMLCWIPTLTLLVHSILLC